MTAAASTSWMVGASCAQRRDLPWTADADAVSTWDRLTMTVLCSKCPVRVACVGYADTVGADAGFWAGAYRDTDLDASAVAVPASGPVWVAPRLPGLGGAA